MSRTCYCAPTLLTRAPFLHMPPLGKLLTVTRSDYFRFGSVFIKKKSNQIKKFFEKKPNRNRVKPTGFGSIRFFGQKPAQTGLARFFRFWLGLFLVFCRFRFGSVRLFWFFAYKT